MWTVSISKGFNPSNQRIFTLTYTNGKETFEESFLMSSYGNAAQAAAIAYARITELENYDSIVEGQITPAPLS